ncbi:MAG: molybdenum cofactor guanylyltransferase [Candidatus Omnitrophica bacterium]|nr:molybdenum cofactor guanylyltransferase [Candidatus Omnitrophota bacterium]
MHERIHDLTAIILAGGKSLRMGRDKSFLNWNGKSLIEHMVENLKKIADDVIIVAKNRERFLFLDIPIYEDLSPLSSPLVGMYTGLSHTKTEFNFMVACDMPFVRSEVVRRLFDSLADYDAVLPESLSGLEPLHGIYRKGCRRVFKVHIQCNSLRIQDALKDLKVLTIPRGEWSDEEFASFSNLNTPYEYQKAQPFQRDPCLF